MEPKEALEVIRDFCKTRENCQGCEIREDCQSYLKEWPSDWILEDDEFRLVKKKEKEDGDS